MYSITYKFAVFLDINDRPSKNLHCGCTVSKQDEEIQRARTYNIIKSKIDFEKNNKHLL